MILHLVRHPRPRVAPDTCYGRLDLPVDELDAAARRLAPLLPRTAPVWSSPLQRCRLLAERLDPRPRLDPRLMEMDFGAWEGRTWASIGRAALDAWAADIADFAPPGGESARQVQARALEFLGELQDSTAIIVTHGGVMRVLQAHWQHLPAQEWSALNFPYASLLTVEFSGAGAIVRLENH